MYIYLFYYSQNNISYVYTNESRVVTICYNIHCQEAIYFYLITIQISDIFEITRPPGWGSRQVN